MNELSLCLGIYACRPSNFTAWSFCCADYLDQDIFTTCTSLPAHPLVVVILSGCGRCHCFSALLIYLVFEGDIMEITIIGTFSPLLFHHFNLIVLFFFFFRTSLGL
ncbi:hypothetical protein L208DRAFT_476847 [Tricholoma matsutake]|nr:hypothetical protein L208DRAFT_476847 [Tricholoma matsutake 945]